MPNNHYFNLPSIFGFIETKILMAWTLLSMSVRNGMAFCAGGDVAVMVRDINGGKVYPCSICHNQFIVEGCIFLLSVYCLVAHFFFLFKIFRFFYFFRSFESFQLFPIGKMPAFMQACSNFICKMSKGNFCRVENSLLPMCMHHVIGD